MTIRQFVIPVSTRKATGESRSLRRGVDYTVHHTPTSTRVTLKRPILLEDGDSISHRYAQEEVDSEGSNGSDTTEAEVRL